jgi:predicted transglutaminase-like protease
MEKQKTAVEWLIDTINKINHDYEVGIIDEALWSIQTYEAHKQAKEMEKDRVIDFAKKFSDFNGLTFNEKEVSKEYLEKLYSNQNQIKIIKTKKCDWCNKRKNIDNGYYIGKLESSKTDKEFFICVDCNLKHDIV